MTDDLKPLPDDWSRALCVAAHPDDIEFGTAGAVAAWTAAGKTVTYLLLTRGEAGIDGMPPDEAAPVREAEQRASAAIVGVKEVEFLDHRDGVIEYGVALRRDIAAAIRRHQPDLVMGYNHRATTFSGRRNSPDHRNAGLAVLDAVIDAGNRWIFPDLRLERWGGVRYVLMAASPRATHAVDVADAVDASVASLEAHRTYLDGLGPIGADVRTPLTGLYAMLGERFGGRPAVAFELVAH
jgi:LmbE family N-acetylglucosaminyl deacetylase